MCPGSHQSRAYSDANGSQKQTTKRVGAVAKRGTYGIPVVLLVGIGMRCLLQCVVVVLGLSLRHVVLATVYVGVSMRFEKRCKSWAAVICVV